MRYFQSVAIAIAAVNLFSMGFADNVCVKEYRLVVTVGTIYYMFEFTKTHPLFRAAHN